MSNEIANEMEKFLNQVKIASTNKEAAQANTTMGLINSTVFLTHAIENLESLGKTGEAKFLWKVINTAQSKLANEINETPPLKKEAADKQDSYQKYSNLLKDI